MIEVVTPGRRFRRIGSSPFSSLGLDYCTRCKSECDTNTEAHHRDGIFVYKRTCDRCGKVVKSGMYSVPLVGEHPLQPVAIQWITEPGKDRR